jgi:hypothetical protein
MNTTDALQPKGVAARIAQSAVTKRRPAIGVSSIVCELKGLISQPCLSSENGG